MYEVLDDTAAQITLAIENGNSIHHVSQNLHTPYETVRQDTNRLEEAGTRYSCIGSKRSGSEAGESVSVSDMDDVDPHTSRKGHFNEDGNSSSDSSNSTESSDGE